MSEEDNTNQKNIFEELEQLAKNTLKMKDPKVEAETHEGRVILHVGDEARAFAEGMLVSVHAIVNHIQDQVR